MTGAARSLGRQLAAKDAPLDEARLGGNGALGTLGLVVADIPEQGAADRRDDDGRRGCKPQMQAG